MLNIFKSAAFFHIGIYILVNTYTNFQRLKPSQKLCSFKFIFAETLWLPNYQPIQGNLAFYFNFEGGLSRFEAFPDFLFKSIRNFVVISLMK